MYVMATDRTLGDRVRRLRVERGLSQSAFARLTGMSASQIAKIETGKSGKMHPATLRVYADVLDVPVDYLRFGGEDAGDAAEEEEEMPPTVTSIYFQLGKPERRAWLEIGHTLRELGGEYAAREIDATRLASYDRPEEEEAAHQDTEE